MRWNSWVTYALLAVIVTIAAATWAPAPGERAVADAMRGLPGTGLWDALTHFVHAKYLFALAAMLVTLAIYVFFPPRDAVIPLAGLAGGLMIDWMLKPLVARPRPGLSGIVHADSFPSSAAILYAAWLGSVGIVCARRIRSDLVRKAVIGTLIAVSALGGIARLTAGDHWPLDVVGAWIWSAAWVLWLDRATKSTAN